MSDSTLPLLAITMGDPAGTGPELIAKTLATPEIQALCRPLVIGSVRMIEQAIRIVGAQAEVVPVARPADYVAKLGTIAVLDLPEMPLDGLQRAKVSALAGKAAYTYIRRAVELTLAGQTAAVVTSAINKASLHEAGHLYDGHTELLAELCGTPDPHGGSGQTMVPAKVTMMLVAGKLRICHVSTHVALSEAIHRVRPPRIIEVIGLAEAGVRRLGIEKPHIAIAGLNPHAGEGGIFGREEIDYIVPAIEEAKRLGFRVSGPFAGDTVFFRTLQGEFDVAIAMYHDQGHVAAKMLGIWQGVNVTLGLPIIRTSVEHGTDFANVGKTTGDPRSLVEAIKLAAIMARQQR